MENGLLFKELLQTPNFRITVVDDADTVELCGALKVNISHASLAAFPGETFLSQQASKSRASELVPMWLILLLHPLKC